MCLGHRISALRLYVSRLLFFIFDPDCRPQFQQYRRLNPFSKDRRIFFDLSVTGGSQYFSDLWITLWAMKSNLVVLLKRLETRDCLTGHFPRYALNWKSCLFRVTATIKDSSKTADKQSAKSKGNQKPCLGLRYVAWICSFLWFLLLHFIQERFLW